MTRTLALTALTALFIPAVSFAGGQSHWLAGAELGAVGPEAQLTQRIDGRPF